MEPWGTPVFATYQFLNFFERNFQESLVSHFLFFFS